MSKFKGTPGPWQVDGHQNGAIWNIDDMAGEAVAMAFPRPSDREYSERTAIDCKSATTTGQGSAGSQCPACSRRSVAAVYVRSCQ